MLFKPNDLPGIRDILDQYKINLDQMSGGHCGQCNFGKHIKYFPYYVFYISRIDHYYNLPIECKKCKYVDPQTIADLERQIAVLFKLKDVL